MATKYASVVADIMIGLLKSLESVIHTITVDNGKEFAHHEQVASELNVDVYFARPYSSWERGLNENTNGLVWQYISKGTIIGIVERCSYPSFLQMCFLGDHEEVCKG